MHRINVRQNKQIPWASSIIQIPRGKTTALMLISSKIVSILRLGVNVFQHLSEILQRKVHIS